MNVVLIGMPASGKTTVGRRLADALGVEFMDTDAMVEQQTGMAISEIFAKKSEEAFRRLEVDAVRNALSGPGVVCLGGGAIMTAAVQALVSAHRVMWLDVPLETLLVRVTESEADLRPLLRGDHATRLAALLDERLGVYRAWATRVDGMGTPEDVVDRILALIKENDQRKGEQISD